MEYYFREGGLPSLYQCSLINRTDEDWLKTGKKSIATGIITILYGSICIVLYIPCLVVFAKKELWVLSAYKIMFLLTLFDMLGLLITCILSGFLDIEGAVYCSYPVMIYIVGTISVGSWTGSCATCVLLAITRVTYLLNRKLHHSLFHGQRIYISMSFCVAYSLFYIFYTYPPLYNSNLATWIWDPLIFPDGSQHNNYGTEVKTIFTNIATCSLNLILYTVYFLVLVYRVHNTNFLLGRREGQIVVQCLLICFINTTCAAIYNLMQFVKVTQFLMILGGVTWKMSCGTGVLVYLFINQTVRNSVGSLLRIPNRINTITSVN